VNPRSWRLTVVAATVGFVVAAVPAAVATAAPGGAPAGPGGPAGSGPPVATTPAAGAAETSSAGAEAGGGATVPARRVPGRKRAVTALSDAESREYLHLKFVEGSDVRLRAGELVSLSGADLSGVRQALSDEAVTQVSRLIAVPEGTLASYGARALSRSGRGQADLNLWYRVRVTSSAGLVRVVGALNAQEVVETAYPAPRPVAPPGAAATPDFRARQEYRRPASSSGIDADYAATVAGGRGRNVRVVDIEYGWNVNHEDLSRLRLPGALIANGTPKPERPDWVDHGTQVIGELSGDDNGIGVLGLIPDAGMHITNVTNVEREYDLATSITLAATRLSPGDVILLEQQIGGPTGCGQQVSAPVAVEWYQAYYDAIVAAVSSGVIVVEAAGNGGQDYDNTCLYGSVFPAGRPDSGAIMVGAGAAPGCAPPGQERSRLGFSNYGRRIDLQGWGNCIVTTGGFGSLHGDNPNNWYTAAFGGTSGASPMVVAAAAAVSSVAEERGLTLTPLQVRDLLKRTGTPQTNVAGGVIGPLPNLRAALAVLPAGTRWSASASGSAAGRPPAHAVDGDPGSYWSTGAPQSNGQYLQVDMGSARRFNRLVLDTGTGQSTHHPRQWAVRVSDDGTRWGDPIATGTGTGQVTTVTVPTTVARHVRITQTGAAAQPWSVAELTVTDVNDDFSVAVNPGALAVRPGASATAAVSTYTVSGAAQGVTLSASGQPAGVSVTFAPASVTSGGGSTMTVTVGASAATGEYPITVTGTGAVSRTATFTLTVSPDGGNCSGVPQWVSTTSYVPSDVVRHSGRRWTSLWWSTGAAPGAPISWNVWRDDGAC